MKLLLENWREYLKEEEGISKSDKLKRLRSARDTIADESPPECFLGSCADTSFLLWHAAVKRSGMSGVELVLGSAEVPHTGEPPTDHVWLTVDGEVFDPTWEYQGISPEEVKYSSDDPVDFEKEPNVLWPFGVDDARESEGWDLATNSIMHHFPTKGSKQ
jgi:hypothetical protein